MTPTPNEQTSPSKELEPGETAPDLPNSPKVNEAETPKTEPEVLEGTEADEDGLEVEGEDDESDADGEDDDAVESEQSFFRITLSGVIQKVDGAYLKHLYVSRSLGEASIM